MTISRRVFLTSVTSGLWLAAGAMNLSGVRSAVPGPDILIAAEGFDYPAGTRLAGASGGLRAGRFGKKSFVNRCTGRKRRWIRSSQAVTAIKWGELRATRERAARPE